MRPEDNAQRSRTDSGGPVSTDGELELRHWLLGWAVVLFQGAPRERDGAIGTAIQRAQNHSGDAGDGRCG